MGSNRSVVAFRHQPRVHQQPSAACAALSERPVGWAAFVTIQDLGSIGEFVAAIATLATLVYLALQIRQNTRSVQLSALEANVQAGNRVRELLIMDEGLSDLHSKGLQGYSQLDRAERLRFGLLLQNLFGSVQAAFIRTRLMGASGTFMEIESFLDSLLVHPGVREWWNRHQSLYSQHFVESVNERLTHLGPAA